MNIEIHPALADILRVGVLRLTILSAASGQDAGLWHILNDTCAAIRSKNQGKQVSEVPGVQEARTLYRTVGLDPTKTRPSSEALLRRVIKGKPLYKIHPLVNLFNLASLISLLPVGLYDESKLSGTRITIRLGDDGWGFDGIRKDRVNVAGRLCVVDQEGPFGSPTADSRRTSIEGDVQSALAIFFQPMVGDPRRLTLALDKGVQLAEAHLSAATRLRAILPSE